MIRVLVVDDHAILRDGIRSLLESQDDILVVGEAGDGSEALEATGTLLPDIVLMAGYVLKRSGRREMLNAIRQVHEQGIFLSGDIAREVFQDYSQAPHTSESDEQHLTDRESQVLKLIIDGNSNQEIALELGISPKTVSVHRTNIMSKLNVQNTVELIRMATNNPLINLKVSE